MTQPHWWHHDRTGDKDHIQSKGIVANPNMPHNQPAPILEPAKPSAADLDAVAEEQKAKENTAGE